MSEVLIDNLVSDKAWQEVKRLDDEISKLANKIANDVKVKDIMGGGTSTAEYDALKAQLDKLQTAYDNLIAKKKQLSYATSKYADEQERQDALAKRQIERLTAQANTTSQYASELKRLEAQMKLNEIEIARLMKAEGDHNKQIGELSAKNGALRQEYMKMQETTGALARKQTSMYGATFQLTQVMRELPNFAISSRIGFMSLSNNLPMLIDSFKILSERVDETGKKLGNIGALKAFGKSLLSLNTVMIIISTLFIMFGDKIGDFIEKMFKGANATDHFTQSTRALIAVTKDYSGTASQTISKVLELGVQITKYGDDTNKAKTIVSNFNDMFHTHLKTIDEVKLAYRDLAEKVIDAAIQMQAAMSLIDKAAAQTLRKQGATTILSQFKKEDVDEARNSFNTLFSEFDKFYANTDKNWRTLGKNKLFTALVEGKTSTNMFAWNAVQSFKDKFETKGMSNELKKAFDLLGTDSGKKMMQAIANEMGSNVAIDSLRKSALELYPDTFYNKNDDKKIKEKVVQTGKEMLAALKAYNEERIKLIKENAKLETEITKTNEDGVINSYEDRYKAAEQYLKNQARIAEIDYKLSESETESGRKKDLVQLKNTQEHNTKLYNNHKISLERYLELTDQYTTAYKNINTNADIEVKEAHDKYEQEMLSATKKYNQEILQIEQDIYAERVKLIDEFTKNQQNRIKTNFTNKKTSESQYTTSETILSKISGFSKSTSVTDAFLQRQENLQTNKATIDGINAKLAIVKKGSEEEKELKRQLWEAQKEMIDQERKNSTSYEVAVEQEKQDLIANITEKSIETLQSLWSAYWKWEQKKISDQKDYYSDVEDEKLQDIQDRANAGVITEKQASEETAATKAYYQSVQDELDKQAAEKKKQQFLFEQGVALANVWINFAQATSSLENLLVGGALTPLYLALALVSTGLIAAQTIPEFFEEGGISEGGLAVMGEKRHEVAILPDGRYFYTPNVPTLYDLPKGTEIMPDAVKWEKDMLQKHLILTQAKGENFDMKAYNEMRELNRTLKRKNMNVNVNIGRELNNLKYIGKWGKA